MYALIAQIELLWAKQPFGLQRKTTSMAISIEKNDAEAPRGPAAGWMLKILSQHPCILKLLLSMFFFFFFSGCLGFGPTSIDHFAVLRIADMFELGRKKWTLCPVQAAWGHFQWGVVRRLLSKKRLVNLPDTRKVSRKKAREMLRSREKKVSWAQTMA